MRQATDLQVRWRQLSTDGGPPRLQSDPAGAEGAYRQLLDELGSLDRYAAHSGSERLSADLLTNRLATLATDTETLSKLPELTAFAQLWDASSSARCSTSSLPAPLTWTSQSPH